MGFLQIILIIVFGILILIWIIHRIKYRNSPVIEVKAKLTDKKSAEVEREVVGARGDRHMFTYETYQLLFELEEGRQLEFLVNEKICENMQEGESGTLTYQGTHFIRFENDRISTATPYTGN